VSIRLAVLGDSIAWGQGASRPSERLTPRLVEGLTHAGFEVEAEVLAVPGARSASLARQVRAALAWQPTLAVVVIGANDLTHRVPAEAAAQDLGEAVRRLVEAGARVVVAPAPDLSSVPHVPVELRPAVRAASDQLRKRQVAAVLEAGGSAADPALTSRAFADDLSLFSADRFHPSSAGYAVIAESLLPALLEAAREVPPG
jgi:lysophospholipase L1-like esterase